MAVSGSNPGSSLIAMVGMVGLRCKFHGPTVLNEYVCACVPYSEGCNHYYFWIVAQPVEELKSHCIPGRRLHRPIKKSPLSTEAAVRSRPRWSGFSSSRIAWWG